MPIIFPSTELRSNQAEIKRAAKKAPVIITDNNNHHYLFMSETEYEHRLQNEAKEAAYAARMAHGIRRAREGIAHGEYVVGAEAAIAKAQGMGRHE